jgi:hypothetical protein
LIKAHQGSSRFIEGKLSNWGWASRRGLTLPTGSRFRRSDAPRASRRGFGDGFAVVNQDKSRLIKVNQGSPEVNHQIVRSKIIRLEDSKLQLVEDGSRVRANQGKSRFVPRGFRNALTLGFGFT